MSFQVYMRVAIWKCHLYFKKSRLRVFSFGGNSHFPRRLDDVSAGEIQIQSKFCANDDIILQCWLCSGKSILFVFLFSLLYSRRHKLMLNCFLVTVCYFRYTYCSRRKLYVCTLYIYKLWTLPFCHRYIYKNSDDLSYYQSR